MKERNWYTCTLMALGGFAIGYAVYTICISPDWLHMVEVMAIVSLICLFPIQLSGQFYYTFDHVASIYLLLTIDWRIAVLPAIIAFLIFHIFRKGSVFNSIVFYPLVTSAIYFINIFTTHYYPFLSTGNMNILALYALTAIQDIISFALNKSIHISILGWSGLHKSRSNDFLFLLLFYLFSTGIIYELYQTETLTELIKITAVSTLTLYILSLISKMAINHQLKADEANLAYEAHLTELGLVLIKMDLKGNLTYINSIGEQITGGFPDSSEGFTLWKLLNADISLIRERFVQVLEGNTQRMNLQLNSLGNGAAPLTATLVPFIQNKKVAAVHLIGKPLT